MRTMTKHEFIGKYGHQYVKFARYYKYAFEFKNDLSDTVIMVCSGGDPYDIYRTEVFANQWVKIEELEIFSGTVWQGRIAVEGFDDEL